MSKNKLYERLQVFTEQVTVYPVSCEKLANGRSDLEWLDGVLSGGAKIIQLRDKESDDRTLLQKAAAFRDKTSEAGALFIVNNRLDIAMLSDADGVHLGNSDIPADEARRLCPELLIGVSANTEDQAASAKDRGASYYNIGPIFPTKTKEGLSEFLGVEAIPIFSSHSPLPFTVMGGIKYNNINNLLEQKAKRIAVVTALTQADDIGAETWRWVNAIKNPIPAT